MAGPMLRATCPVCGQSVPLKRSGLFRQHYVRKSQLEQEPEKGLAGTHRVCPGREPGRK